MHVRTRFGGFARGESPFVKKHIGRTLLLSRLLVRHAIGIESRKKLRNHSSYRFQGITALVKIRVSFGNKNNILVALKMMLGVIR